MNKLIYVILIEPGDADHAFGVEVPDLPGCFSAGDTFAEAVANAKSAIEAHLAVLVDEGMAIPEPTDIAAHRLNPDFADRLWGFVEVDNIPELKKSVRLNISLPQGLLKEIDQYAKAHHLTRSGFLAEAVKNAMRETA
jgi:predicted RNase H-like HicB family nuclease